MASKSVKARQLLERPFDDLGLGEQQAKVARLAAIGYKTDEIGAELGLAVGTAASHLRAVKAKTSLIEVERRVDRLGVVKASKSLGLTAEQIRVGLLVYDGLSMTEISEKLQIDNEAVVTHLAQVSRKAGWGKFGLTRELIRRLEVVLS